MSGEERTPRIVGRYELHGELASGGMATVYMGRLLGDHGFATCVAIKRLHEHLSSDAELVSVLLEEARISGRIRHPNVVATLDVVADGGEVLLVMEYVHGETVARLLRASVEAGVACPPAVAASIVHDALLGLAAAHASTDAGGQPLEIIHRDVSPQNVIVGADGVARVLDFGIAKAVGSIAHTRTGEVKGKVPYMAPEVLRFEPASPRSDVWAAAVVLWEMLCSRRLFTGDTQIDIWGKVLSMPIPTPSSVTHPGTATTALDEVVCRGLARDPAERWASATEMALALQRALPLASQADVAVWVTSAVRRTLDTRTALLRAVEATPVTARTAAAGSTVKGAKAPPSRAPWVLTAALTIAVVVLAGMQLSRAREARRPASSSIAPELTAAAPPVVSSERSPSPEPSPSPPAPVAAPPTTTTRRGPLVEPKRRPKPAGVDAGHVKPPSDPCEPPYSIDVSGRKIFKLECVKEK